MKKSRKIIYHFFTYVISIPTFLLLILLFSCDSNITISTNLDRLDSLRMGKTMKIDFSLNNSKIDSFNIVLNDNIYKEKEIKLDSSNVKLGYNKLYLNIFYNKKFKTIKQDIIVYSNNKEKTMQYKIVKKYPHDPLLFTQGLIYDNGLIYESSGQYGKSKLVVYELGSNKYLQEKIINPNYFAEGITFFKGRIYQLTWKERKILIYNKETLDKIETIDAPSVILEGWGAVTINNNVLVISDSSSTLKFFDENLNLIKEVTVVGYNRVYPMINALTYANGLIYANVFMEDTILAINPSNGKVVGVAHLMEIVRENQSANKEAVLNGIANISGNEFIVTGKLWSNMYKIKLEL